MLRSRCHTEVSFHYSTPSEPPNSLLQITDCSKNNKPSTHSPNIVVFSPRVQKTSIYKFKTSCTMFLRLPCTFLRHSNYTVSATNIWFHCRCHGYVQVGISIISTYQLPAGVCICPDCGIFFLLVPGNLCWPLIIFTAVAGGCSRSHRRHSTRLRFRLTLGNMCRFRFCSPRVRSSSIPCTSSIHCSPRASSTRIVLSTPSC